MSNTPFLGPQGSQVIALPSTRPQPTFWSNSLHAWHTEAQVDARPRYVRVQIRDLEDCSGGVLMEVTGDRLVELRDADIQAGAWRTTLVGNGPSYHGEVVDRLDAHSVLVWFPDLDFDAAVLLLDIRGRELHLVGLLS